LSVPGHILASAVYQLALRPEELPANLRLPSSAWAVLFSLSGRHSVAQIGAQLGLTPESRDRAFGDLLAADLVVERRLSMAEYLRSAGTIDDDERRTFGAFLRGAPARPAAVPPIGPTLEANEDADPEVAPRTSASEPMPSPSRAKATSLAVAPFRPLALPEEETPMNTPPSLASRTLNLRVLNRLFFERSVSPEQAQLDLYRVYLRVDAQLLTRAGITTLKFEEDRLVDDPELVERLSQSAADALGAPLPESVWAKASTAS
jgi:hypothetical protein